MLFASCGDKPVPQKGEPAEPAKTSASAKASQAESSVQALVKERTELKAEIAKKEARVKEITDQLARVQETLETSEKSKSKAS